MIPLLVVIPLLSADRTLCYGNLVVAYLDTNNANNTKVDIKIYDFGNLLMIE